MPFGGGPRLCPGRSLAMLEIKMALSMICRHYDLLRTEPEREIEERFVFTMMPQDLKISLQLRWKQSTLPGCASTVCPMDRYPGSAQKDERAFAFLD